MASKKELERRIEALQNEVNGITGQLGYYSRDGVTLYDRIMAIANELGIKGFTKTYKASVKIIKKKSKKKGD